MSTRVSDTFAEMKKLTKELQEEHGREVFVTSKRNRDKGSVDGQTVSVTPENASRCIVDETHRLATDDEIKSFYKLQSDNLKITNAKERKKQQTLILQQTNPESITPPSEKPEEELVGAGVSTGAGTSRK